MRGAGVDLTVNNQAMTGQFVRQPITGDCEVTVRLDSRTGTGADRVGLLMAKSLSPFDQAAGAIVSGGTIAQLMLRTTVAGRSAFTGDATVTTPCLLRLKRNGTVFAAAVSTDGGVTFTPSPRERSPASVTPPTTWVWWSAPAARWPTAPRDSAR